MERPAGSSCGSTDLGICLTRVGSGEGQESVASTAQHMVLWAEGMEGGPNVHGAGSSRDLTRTAPVQALPSGRRVLALGGALESASLSGASLPQQSLASQLDIHVGCGCGVSWRDLGRGLGGLASGGGAGRGHSGDLGDWGFRAEKSNSQADEKSGCVRSDVCPPCREVFQLNVPLAPTFFLA